MYPFLLKSSKTESYFTLDYFYFLLICYKNYLHQINDNSFFESLASD